jgi:hypothetical protein
MQVLDLKQASVTKQASVNNQHLDQNDKLFSKTASHAKMETSTMQDLDLDLEQWLTEKASVTNQRLDLEDQLFSKTSSRVKTEASTMQHLREMTSECNQDQSTRTTTRRTR